MKPVTIEQVRNLAKRKKKKRARLTKKQYLERYLCTPPAVEKTEADKEKQRALFERHDKAVIFIRLPLAPSIDHYYIHWLPKGHKRVVTTVSSEGQAYKEAVGFFWCRHFNGWPPDPFTGRIRLLVEVHMARKGGDIGNRDKAIEDALTECKAWIDDSQVDSLRYERGEVISPTGAMDVIIEVIGD